MIADRQSKRQRILNDDRITADISLFADATKLVHAGISADVRTIFNDDMSCQCRGVCHDHAISDQAIVCDVCLGHDQTIVASPCQHAATGGAAMNRDELAYVVARADPRFGWFTLVLQILRSETDRDERKYVRARTD